MQFAAACIIGVCVVIAYVCIIGAIVTYVRDRADAIELLLEEILDKLEKK